MKALLKALPFAAVLMSGGASVAVAADNFGSDATPKAVAADQVILPFTCLDLDCAWLLLCTTNGSFISASVADEFLEGDVWRANMIRWNGREMLSTSNQDASGIALLPGVFSQPVEVNRRVAFITLAAAGPNIDLPAGFSLLVGTSDPLQPNCQVIAESPSGPFLDQ